MKTPLFWITFLLLASCSEGHEPLAAPSAALRMIEIKDLGETVRTGGILQQREWNGWQASFELSNTGEIPLRYSCRGEENPSLVIRSLTKGQMSENSVDYWCGTGVEERTLTPNEVLPFTFDSLSGGEYQIGIRLFDPRTEKEIWIWSEPFMNDVQ